MSDGLGCFVCFVWILIECQCLLDLFCFASLQLGLFGFDCLLGCFLCLIAIASLCCGDLGCGYWLFGRLFVYDWLMQRDFAVVLCSLWLRLLISLGLYVGRCSLFGFGYLICRVLFELLLFFD